jgi:hypothetical protein
MSTEVKNINVSSFVSTGMKTIEGMAGKLDAQMKAINDGSKEMSQQDLLKMQYELGRYQGLMTAMNNTVSSIQGHAKEMANSIR